MIYDSSKIVDGHVVWTLLSADEQADLLANYPAGVGLVDGTERFEAWLDGAYLSRTTIASGLDPIQS